MFKQIRTVLVLLVTVQVAALVSGCNPVADTFAPTVESVFPASDARTVPLNSAIVVNFSEPMSSDSLNSETVLLDRASDGADILGAVIPTDTAVVFIPSEPLDGNTEYQLTVTTEAVDVAGNHLSRAFMSTFTTSEELDRTAPRVRSHIPAHMAREVRVGDPIQISLNEAIDPSTVSPSTVRIVNATDGARVVCTVWASGTVIRLLPVLPLQKGVEFQIEISSDIADLSGNHLAAPYRFSFVTESARWSDPVLAEESAASGRLHAAVAHEGGLVTFAYVVGEDAYVNTFSSESGLGTPLLVGAATRSVELAVDRGGDVLVLWNGGSTLMPEVSLLRRSAATGSWSTPFVLSNPARSASFPKMTVGSDGTILVAWHEVDRMADLLTLVARVYRPDTGWEAASNLTSTQWSRGFISFASLASHPIGGLRAYWTYYSPSTRRYYMQGTRRLPGESAWVSQLSLSDFDNDVNALTATFTDAGSFLLLWSEQEYDGDVPESHHVLKGAVYAHTTGALTQTLLTDSIQRFEGLRLVPMSTGQAMATWSTGTLHESSVFNEVVAGVPVRWSPVRSLNDLTRAASVFIKGVSTDASRSTLFAYWMELAHTSYQLKVARYTTALGWSLPETVVAPAEGTIIRSAAVVAGDSNHPVALFSTTEGSAVENIFLSQFD